MKTLIQLRKRLDELKEQIVETQERLPAHSTKPPVMMDLLALEDEYDAVMNQIDRRKEVTALYNHMAAVRVPRLTRKGFTREALKMF